MNFLGLVNRLIQESGAELNELDVTSWDAPDTGRRQYPRFKRYVANAWKAIQMQRDQWEFNSGKVNTTVYPRFKFTAGAGTRLPVPGDQFIGLLSGVVITVRQFIAVEGDWLNTLASGQVEFTVPDNNNGKRIQMNELFSLVNPGLESITFNYLERGSYDFGLSTTDLNEIQPTTFTISRERVAPIPAIYIPWESALYSTFEYAQGTSTPPVYFSTDYQGQVVFLNQTFTPFLLSFVYSRTPQMLTLATDVPAGLPEHYHEWIMWDALKSFATYDKNPQLFRHADSQVLIYKLRAENNLLPKVAWRGNPYND